MNEKKELISQSFQSEATDSRIKLLVEDIQAASKQLAALNQQSLDLTQTLKNLEFNLDELRVEKESLLQVQEASGSEPQMNESAFFSKLTELENREIEAKGKLEGHQQLTQDLKHQRNQLLNKNQKLKNQLEIELNRLENEEQDIIDIGQAIKDLDTQVLELQEQNDFLVNQCDTLKEEEEKRSKELVEIHTNKAAQLQESKGKLDAEYQQMVDATKKLKGKIAADERNMSQKIAILRKQLEKEQSVSTWKTEREILLSKLRKLRAQLLTEQKTEEKAKKRDSDLSQRFKDLFNDQDPGDGSSDAAKKVVLAEIESLETFGISETTDELENEKEYEAQLKEQMRLLDDSIAVFEKYREETLSSLDQEYQECSQDGYLAMLKEEMSELQSKLFNK